MPEKNSFWPYHWPLLLLLLYCSLHFSPHFIRHASTFKILKYSEAKNGQIYLKTVMRMNITVSVNKSFCFTIWSVEICVYVSFSIFLFLSFRLYFLGWRSLHNWKYRNLWVRKVVYEKRFHNIELSQTVAYFNHSIEFIEMTCCGPILDISHLCGSLWGRNNGFRFVYCLIMTTISSRPMKKY